MAVTRFAEFLGKFRYPQVHLVGTHTHADVGGWYPGTRRRAQSVRVSGAPQDREVGDATAIVSAPHLECRDLPQSRRARVSASICFSISAPIA